MGVENKHITSHIISSPDVQVESSGTGPKETVLFAGPKSRKDPKTDMKEIRSIWSITQ